MEFLRKALLWAVLAPSLLTFTGAASNQLVLVANHGKFPVMVNQTFINKQEPDANGMWDDEHCVMTKDTHLNFLADIFNFHSTIESVGDLLLRAGDATRDYAFVVALLVILKRKERE